MSFDEDMRTITARSKLIARLEKQRDDALRRVQDSLRSGRRTEDPISDYLHIHHPERLLKPRTPYEALAKLVADNRGKPLVVVHAFDVGLGPSHLVPGERPLRYSLQVGVVDGLLGFETDVDLLHVPVTLKTERYIDVFSSGLMDWWNDGEEGQMVIDGRAFNHQYVPLYGDRTVPKTFKFPQSHNVELSKDERGIWISSIDDMLKHPGEPERGFAEFFDDVGITDYAFELIGYKPT